MMTANELFAEVVALGYGTSTPSGVAFTSAANRALRRIYGERRIIGSHSFFAIGRTPVTRYPLLRHAGGIGEKLPVSGKAFSCFAHGQGRITVYCEDLIPRVYSFNGDGVRVTGTLGRGASICLGSTGAIYITDLVTYDDIENLTDRIPDGSPITRYDPKEMVGDFKSLVGSPTDERGEVLKGVFCSGGLILAPSDYTGRVFFRYFKRPPTVTSADMDVELELPEEVIEPLAPLVASYIYLDISPQLAEKYAELYREAMKRAPKPQGLSYGTGYRDTDGWA